MAPILVRAAITVTGGELYCQVVPGLYTGDIASAVDIVAATPTTDYANEVLTPIKNLLRAGELFTLHVMLKDSNSLKTYKKTLHCGYLKFSNLQTLESDLVGKIWPIGTGAGFPIDSIFFPTKVVSRTY